MLSENLYRDILLAPAKKGADTLYIVSGYASAGMAHQHIRAVQESLGSKEPPIHVNLIVGMGVKDGIAKSTHLGFVSLTERTLKQAFTCGYVMQPPQIHAKVYAWFRGDKPMAGYVGSANYTQAGFLRSQREVMTPEDPRVIREYHKMVSEESCFCTHSDVQGIVREDNLSVFTGEEIPVSPPAEETATTSFLDADGNLPRRSGLNWGQRPEQKREPNQAYIPVPAKVYNSGFFPPREDHFTLHTDDGQAIICACRQQRGKAIQSPGNNSIIGEYFRRRLGVPLGEPVVKADLEKYGRFDIVFHKIDDDNYYMDFSPPSGG